MITDLGICNRLQGTIKRSPDNRKKGPPLQADPLLLQDALGLVTEILASAALRDLPIARAFDQSLDKTEQE